MRELVVYNHDIEAGILFEENGGFCFAYLDDYKGEPISLTLPVRPQAYKFSSFPPFFEGLLPEGFQLESLLRAKKIDADDYLGQLEAIGQDCVGSITVHSR
ncbi:MAG: HipA N-terminal domain-containing protein [Vulcanimicrobiota bacterium]